MAHRRSKQNKASKAPGRAKDATAPFNNPFAAGARAVKSQLAKHKKRTIERRIAAEQEAGRIEAERPRGFDDEMNDVMPIAHEADRIATRQSADIDTIEGAQKAAREAEIAEMAGLKSFDIRYSDQYIRGTSEDVGLETVRKLESGEFSLQAHLDLHGMVVEDARVEVDRFLVDSHGRGYRCVLIITGKGKNSVRQTGVLREDIPHWLARGPSSRLVLAFTSARDCDGGGGAIYVLLRGRRGRKTRIEVVMGGIGD